MWQQTTTACSSHAPHSGSQHALCRLGRPISAGFPRKSHRRAAEPHHALELVHRETDVPERQHGERNEPAGMLAAPTVEMPVVVGLNGRERELLVLHFLEARAREAGK